MSKHTMVIDARMINYSGIGTYIQNIVPFLLEHFKLILMGDEMELNGFQWAEKTKIISFNANIYSVKEQLLYPKVIPRTNLLWCPHFNVPLFPIKANKLVCTLHDVNHLALKKAEYSIKYVYAKRLITKAVKKSDTIITVSKFSKSEILEYTQATPNQIKIIPNGISPNFCKTAVNDLAIKLPENYFLFVGNVKPHKNLVLLLKAYLKLPINIQNKFKIVVLGKKEGFITSDKKVFNFIKKYHLHEKVLFTGYLPNNTVSKVYRKAYIFIFPSNYEGFGLPLLEAMSCETPVICSDIDPFKEVAGKSVIYFKKNNANSLKEKIILLLNDGNLKRKLVEKGKLVTSQYTWERAANEHIKLFHSIIS